jgi:hypothetical protein
VLNGAEVLFRKATGKGFGSFWKIPSAIFAANAKLGATLVVAGKINPK